MKLPTVSNLLFPDWTVPDNVVAYVTTRLGGVSQGPYASFNLGSRVGDDPSHVLANRQRLQNSLGPDVQLQWLNQVHGNRVIEARRDATPRDADAAFTTEPGIACCVSTADCLPVFFASLHGDAVALAHAGWRGLAAGVLENCVEALPVKADQCIAWLGPAIGPCHFEVGAEVRECFMDASPALQSRQLERYFQPGAGEGKFKADLYGLARVRLHNLGIRSIGGWPGCTYCQEDRFYSFRRQTQTGRMLSLIYLKS